ncbi:hypothetical protein AYI68_g6104 [Smittium mucronatum]|uniref:Uncharacterized protein n=1 Tax=Smittium mucronatum TaxID=133383 RepID=A0A1R0GSH2_9FUNG|nr:hypothetical protein AYI68_g6104 [Smittium mucronatum]
MSLKADPNPHLNLYSDDSDVSNDFDVGGSTNLAPKDFQFSENSRNIIQLEPPNFDSKTGFNLNENNLIFEPNINLDPQNQKITIKSENSIHPISENIITSSDSNPGNLKDINPHNCLPSNSLDVLNLPTIKIAMNDPSIVNENFPKSLEIKFTLDKKHSDPTQENFLTLESENETNDSNSLLYSVSNNIYQNSNQKNLYESHFTIDKYSQQKEDSPKNLLMPPCPKSSPPTEKSQICSLDYVENIIDAEKKDPLNNENPVVLQTYSIKNSFFKDFSGIGSVEHGLKLRYDSKNINGISENKLENKLECHDSISPIDKQSESKASTHFSTESPKKSLTTEEKSVSCLNLKNDINKGMKIDLASKKPLSFDLTSSSSSPRSDKSGALKSIQNFPLPNITNANFKPEINDKNLENSPNYAPTIENSSQISDEINHILHPDNLNSQSITKHSPTSSPGSVNQSVSKSNINNNINNNPLELQMNNQENIDGNILYDSQFVLPSNFDENGLTYNSSLKHVNKVGNLANEEDRTNPSLKNSFPENLSDNYVINFIDTNINSDVGISSSISEYSQISFNISDSSNEKILSPFNIISKKNSLLNMFDNLKNEVYRNNDIETNNINSNILTDILGFSKNTLDISGSKPTHNIFDQNLNQGIPKEKSDSLKSQKKKPTPEPPRRSYSFRKRTDISLHPFTKFKWTNLEELPFSMRNKVDVSVLNEPLNASPTKKAQKQKNDNKDSPNISIANSVKKSKKSVFDSKVSKLLTKERKKVGFYRNKYPKKNFKPVKKIPNNNIMVEIVHNHNSNSNLGVLDKRLFEWVNAINDEPPSDAPDHYNSDQFSIYSLENKNSFDPDTYNQLPHLNPNKIKKPIDSNYSRIDDSSSGDSNTSNIRKKNKRIRVVDSESSKYSSSSLQDDYQNLYTHKANKVQMKPKKTRITKKSIRGVLPASFLRRLDPEKTVTQKKKTSPYNQIKIDKRKSVPRKLSDNNADFRPNRTDPAIEVLEVWKTKLLDVRRVCFQKKKNLSENLAKIPKKPINNEVRVQKRAQKNDTIKKKILKDPQAFFYGKKAKIKSNKIATSPKKFAKQKQVSSFYPKSRRKNNFSRQSFHKSSYFPEENRLDRIVNSIIQKNKSLDGYNKFPQFLNNDIDMFVRPVQIYDQTSTISKQFGENLELYTSTHLKTNLGSVIGHIEKIQPGVYFKPDTILGSGYVDSFLIFLASLSHCDDKDVVFKLFPNFRNSFIGLPNTNLNNPSPVISSIINDQSLSPLGKVKSLLDSWSRFEQDLLLNEIELSEISDRIILILVEYTFNDLLTTDVNDLNPKELSETTVALQKLCYLDNFTKNKDIDIFLKWKVLMIFLVIKAISTRLNLKLFNSFDVGPKPITVALGSKSSDNKLEFMELDYIVSENLFNHSKHFILKLIQDIDKESIIKLKSIEKGQGVDGIPYIEILSSLLTWFGTGSGLDHTLFSKGLPKIFKKPSSVDDELFLKKIPSEYRILILQNSDTEIDEDYTRYIKMMNHHYSTKIETKQKLFSLSFWAVINYIAFSSESIFSVLKFPTGNYSVNDVEFFTGSNIEIIFNLLLPLTQLSSVGITSTNPSSSSNEFYLVLESILKKSIGFTRIFEKKNGKNGLNSLIKWFCQIFELVHKSLCCQYGVKVPFDSKILIYTSKIVDKIIPNSDNASKLLLKLKSRFEKDVFCCKVEYDNDVLYKNMQILYTIFRKWNKNICINKDDRVARKHIKDWKIVTSKLLPTKTIESKDMQNYSKLVQYQGLLLTIMVASNDKIVAPQRIAAQSLGVSKKICDRSEYLLDGKLWAITLDSWNVLINKLLEDLNNIEKNLIETQTDEPENVKKAGSLFETIRNTIMSWDSYLGYLIIRTFWRKRSMALKIQNEGVTFIELDFETENQN